MTKITVTLDNLARLRARPDRSVLLVVVGDDTKEIHIELGEDTIRQIEGVLSEV